MKTIKTNWQKKFFNNKFYKIYYYYFKKNYLSYIDRLINFSNLKKESNILDLACGSGDYLMALKKRGFNNLSGLDYFYANITKKNVGHLGIQIKKGDMRKEFGNNIYDFIMMCSTSFGYFDEKDNKKVLKNCYKALKPNGKLFIDNLSAEFIISNFQSKNWTKFKDNVFFLEERELSKDKKYLSMLWFLLEKGKLYILSSRLRLYTKNEFKTLFKKIGFKKVKVKNAGVHNWFLAIK